MAVIAPVRSSLGVGIEVITWSPIAAGDTCTGSLVSGQSGAIGNIQATGTFGGATIALTGSNDGSTYSNVTDGAGNSASFSAAGMKEFSTAAAYIAPAISGGAGSSVTVRVVLRG